MDNLKNIIENKNKCADFLLIYKEEIEEYIRLSQSKDSVPVYSNITVNNLTKEELTKIFELYLEDIILEWDLEYILSVLEMAYSGDDERVEELIFYFADPYLNYFINKENINLATKYLNGKIEDLKLESVSIRQTQKGKGCRPNYKSKIW